MVFENGIGQICGKDNTGILDKIKNASKTEQKLYKNYTTKYLDNGFSFGVFGNFRDLFVCDFLKIVFKVFRVCIPSPVDHARRQAVFDEMIKKRRIRDADEIHNRRPTDQDFLFVFAVQVIPLRGQ